MTPTILYSALTVIDYKESSLRSSILRVLAYFDIFHYPLLKEEIFNYLDQKCNNCYFIEWLSILEQEQIIYKYKDFYSLQNNPLLIHRRIEGNERAVELLKRAKKIGRFLQRFPFVRGVGISGSLSKNFADQYSDIDFFIITASNRLWIARTCMHLFKKLTFLFGQQHFYCMNYYVDESRLTLEERNIYAAIELKTLIPVGGLAAMKVFNASNTWAVDYLPQLTPQNNIDAPEGKNVLKSLVEKMFDFSWGDVINRKLFNITTKRWEKKKEKGKKNGKGMKMGMATDIHFARSNPGAFQEKVLGLYEEKVNFLGVGK